MKAKSLQKAIAVALKWKSRYGQVVVQADRITKRIETDRAWTFVKNDEDKRLTFYNLCDALRQIPQNNPFVDELLKSEIQDLKRRYAESAGLEVLTELLEEVPELLQDKVEAVSEMCFNLSAATCSLGKVK